VQAATGAWVARGAREKLEHVRYKGGHSLTPERTEKIISWVAGQANG
jgi:predicted esterase